MDEALLQVSQPGGLAGLLAEVSKPYATQI
jgi:hypothetical protein